MILRAQAPAKINRELRVGPRRTDGYHDILSLFTSIDLADVIEAESAGELGLSVVGAAVAADSNNLVLKAAVALAEYLGIAPRARIRLTKNIPVGAGLGGGSSDAAVTLLMLAQLWKAEVPQDQLLALAARLGSDVAFFLIGGQADVRGRGEQVTPREDSFSETIHLLVPPFSLSTAQVYAAFDSTPGASERILPASLDVETSGRFFGPNDLASAVLQIQDQMGMYLRAAAVTGVEHTMTGSGSAIALRGLSSTVAEQLAQAHPECRLLPCRTIGRKDFQQRIRPSGGTSWR